MAKDVKEIPEDPVYKSHVHQIVCGVNGDHAALHVVQVYKEEILWIWIDMIFIHAMDMRKGIAMKNHAQVKFNF